MRRALAGTCTDDDGPTAMIRLPSITMVAFSITPGVPWIGPGFKPAMVITRAPTSASAPDGLSLLAVNPIGMPLASGSSRPLAGPPATNVNVSAEIAREQLRPERPIDAAAVARPVQIETGVARDALHGIRLRRRSDVDRTAGARKRRDEGLEPLLEREPLSIGRRRELRRVVAAHVLDFVASGQRGPPGRHADAEQRVLLVADLAEVDARARVIELGVGATLAHQNRIAAGQWRRRNTPGSSPKNRPARLIAAGVPVHDLLAVRRERRLDVVAGPA